MLRAYRLGSLVVCASLAAAPVSGAREPLARGAAGARVEPSLETAVVTVHLPGRERIRSALLAFDVGADVHVEAHASALPVPAAGSAAGEASFAISFDTPYPIACDAPGSVAIELADGRHLVLSLACSGAP